ncbi:MAG: HNH endonuclease [Chloroflexi bacterium]|nr:HNH endonuclease [Chloroflexota bacterium]
MTLPQWLPDELEQAVPLRRLTQVEVRLEREAEVRLERADGFTEPIEFLRELGEIGDERVVVVRLRGGKSTRKEMAFVPEAEYAEYQENQLLEPVALQPTPWGSFWWYRDQYYEDDERMTAEEVRLTLFDRDRRRGQKFDRLRKIAARVEDIVDARRERIPDDVRAFVWERDEGRCVRCGTDEDLQFDHVIPVAKGGGNSIENVQVLCGDCNRAKSDSIV